jgi:hypothetical protein
MRRRQFFGLVGGALAGGIVRPPAVGENSIRIGKFEPWPQLAVAPSPCSAERISRPLHRSASALSRISHSDCDVTSLIPVKCVCRMDRSAGNAFVTSCCLATSRFRTHFTLYRV